MSMYTETIKEKHKATIKRMMVLNPNITILGIMEALEKKDAPLSRPYVTKMVKRINGEWLHKYDRETKITALAKIEELFDWLVQNLRKIIQDEEIVYTYTLTEGGDKSKKNKIRTFSQMNRINAIKEIRETVKTMMSMKMDAGILERKLGTLTHEFDIVELRDLSKQIYDQGKNIREAQVVERERLPANDGSGSR